MTEYEMFLVWMGVTAGYCLGLIVSRSHHKLMRHIMNDLTALTAAVAALAAKVDAMKPGAPDVTPQLATLVDQVNAIAAKIPA